ncbi:phosphoribosylformylglycinamidine synthase I [candidate division BRC1 bacterium HGW-BRC1-1]|jgi:phosphoribosylformylglycinamidine synthase|nr:MAG: phosphoribosylformylglycinamidine synthase I [candidate division BRC1 bacterium HGW-BRC1-1]
MKSAVVIFPGSNCEMDTVLAIEKISGRTPEKVWHKDSLPSDTDLVVLPGGFSYGDYLRVGAIAKVSPVMQSVQRHAEAGGLTIGICNGFQILLECGLLPGAMMRNRGLHFVCKWTNLKVTRNDTPFTRFSKDVLHIPVAHATGNYFVEPGKLQEIEDRGQVLFRYCTPEGELTDAANPNGSLNSIAGITNEQGNVLGLMPHPERAINKELGSADGILFWESVLGAQTVSTP